MLLVVSLLPCLSVVAGEPPPSQGPRTSQHQGRGLGEQERSPLRGLENPGRRRGGNEGAEEKGNKNDEKRKE